MSLEYRIYSNGGTGGPVDLSTIVATVSALTWSSGTITPPADLTYLVRAYDTASGLEDPNGDARARVVLNAAGVDISALPAAPVGLSASPRAGGTARVSWRYSPGSLWPPSDFHVYLGAGSVSYTTPVATVPYDAGSPGRAYSALISGLSDGVTYAVGVRAYSAAGEEQNTASAAVTGMVAGPAAVQSLTVAAIP